MPLIVFVDRQVVAVTAEVDDGSEKSLRQNIALAVTNRPARINILRIDKAVFASFVTGGTCSWPRDATGAIVKQRQELQTPAMLADRAAVGLVVERGSP